MRTATLPGSCRQHYRRGTRTAPATDAGFCTIFRQLCGQPVRTVRAGERCEALLPARSPHHWPRSQYAGAGRRWRVAGWHLASLRQDGRTSARARSPSPFPASSWAGVGGGPFDAGDPPIRGSHQASRDRVSLTVATRFLGFARDMGGWWPQADGSVIRSTISGDGGIADGVPITLPSVETVMGNAPNTCRSGLHHAVGRRLRSVLCPIG